ncbi:MAG: Gfo/Idh/MocA family oxidoreductase [Planctomycetes bacterium]|nr:Gfo/Idh/MocA family oxidoreductase [Planctomycetota bacterium]
MADGLRVAFVGCGAIARSHAEALPAVPALQLAAVADPDPAARAAIAGGRVPAFASLDELLAARLPLHAALVLTPPHLHEPQAARLLAAGLHVLCEKPLVPTAAAAERLFAVARAADRRLVLASKFRHGADVAAARALLAEAAIGPLRRYENVFAGRVAMAGRWQADPLRSGGGVLMDNGPHVADLARCLLGPLARVAATCPPPAPGLVVEDTVHLQFTSAAGVLGTADLSWRVPFAQPWYVRLSGDDGAIELGWQQSRWRRHDADWQVLGRGYDKRAAFAALLADFAAACTGTRAPSPTADDAAAAVRFVAAAYRAAQSGTWCDVGDATLP